MSYLKYINIKQGTDSVNRFSNGNTQPHTCEPFGMASFCPQTRGSNKNDHFASWFYHPSDRSFEGIRLTHMACNWIGDYGHIVFMPQSGKPQVDIHNRWSSFRPEDAILSPDYIKINALRYRYDLELTPSCRCSIMRINWQDKNDLPRFAVLPFDGESTANIIPEKRMITGFTRAKVNPSADNFASYFVLQFDCDFDIKDSFTTEYGNHLFSELSRTGFSVGCNVALKSHNVTVRIGTSFISVDQAIENLKEVKDKTFEKVRSETAAKWENKLSKIIVESSDEQKLKTFYSCLYRLFIFPRTLHEYSEGKAIHYQANDGTVKEGLMYVDNGFWDTVRTVYPLLSLIAPDDYQNFLEGFVNTYKDIGWLPKWPSPAEVGLMPGTYIDGVIADATVKGIGSKELIQLGYEGMLKHATIQAKPNERYGRHGTNDYNKFGYLPYTDYHESVNHTLDYIYGDYCIGTVAGILGDKENESKYLAKSKNYRLIFDKATGFMRAKDKKGEFRPNFDKYDWGGEYTEGGAFQNSFAVYHDTEGLATLHGGTEAFEQKLDEVFETKPYFNAGPYNYEMHEMSEMAAVDFGQCAISNQPSFHIPYLYSKIGNLSKTQYWVEKMCNDLISYKDNGFPGDEDTGTMAGWYIFGCLGFYPICPGKAEYTISKPLFDKLTIKLENGNTINVLCKNANPTKVYVDGKVLTSTTITHTDITNSKNIIFK